MINNNDDNNNMIVFGVAYHPGEDPLGVRFSHDEMGTLATSIKDLDVYIEHDADSVTKKVGSVKNAFLGPDKELYVFIETSLNEPYRGSLNKLLESGFFKGLSLSHNIEIETKQGFMHVTQKKPVELSICKKGDIPDTDIIDFFQKKDLINDNGAAHDRIVSRMRSRKRKHTNAG